MKLHATIATLLAASLTLAAHAQLQAAPAAAPQLVPGPELAGLGGLAEPAPKAPRQPLSAEKGVQLPNPMPFIEVPAIDLAQVLAEDAADTSGRLREGVSRPMNFDLGMGAFLEVPAAQGGGWLWVVDVAAPGAYGVRVHFDNFHLPEGAQAIVYDPQIPGNLPWPYTGDGLVDTKEFWAWTSWSQTARVEVYLPPNLGPDHVKPYFTIDQGMRFYRDPMTGQTGAYGSRVLACHNDIECYSNWILNGAGVGRMAFVINGGGVSCSGAMLNNSAGDFTPYFMTARHCTTDSTEALNSMEVYWFFQRAGCSGAVPDMGNCPRSGVATYVHTLASTDMSLIMIEGTVPRNIWWAGNNSASFADGTGCVGIHHPRGTEKRISFGTAGGNAGCADSGLQYGYYVGDTSGTVEPGSSGSPLFLTNGAFIGALSCGPNPPLCPSLGSYQGIYSSWFVGYGAFQNFVNNPGSDDQYENNDSCAIATNLNSYYNGTLYNLVVKVNNPDWFHITVPPGGDCAFHIHFTHANGDTDMQLHDGCGSTLVYSTGVSDDENISWHNSSGLAKEVYLNVYLYSDTRNSYYLDFSRNSNFAPSNDVCSFAAEMPFSEGIPNDGSRYGTTNGANSDGSINCSDNLGAPDVWFRISSLCTRPVTLDTQGSSFDTTLSVHTGCPGTIANQIACNDDFGISTWSRLTFTVNEGQYYYVRISGWHGQAGGYQLNYHLTTASNDNCQNAIAIAPGTIQFNNCPCTTDGPPDNLCFIDGSDQIYRDHWYTYTPTCYGIAYIDTYGSTRDTRLAAYESPDNVSTCPVGPNSAIRCNDDANGTQQSLIVVPMAANRKYIIRAGSYHSYEGGPGTLHLAYDPSNPCIPIRHCQADFNGDGDLGTDADIAAFFACLGGNCCPTCEPGDFNGDGDIGTDADIASFFRVLSGGPC